MSVLYIILASIVVIIGIFFYLRRRSYLGKKMILTEQDYTTLFISVPKENEKTPQAAEALFAALHGIYRTKGESRGTAIQDLVSFEIVAQKGSIKFYVFVPNHLKDFVEGQIYAQYPDIEIQEVEDYARVSPGDASEANINLSYSGTELELNKNYVYPIKTFVNFEVDPLASITAVLSKVERVEQVWIQIIVRPVSDEWQNEGISHVEAIKAGGGGGGNFGTIILKGVFNFLRELFLAATQPSREAEGPGEVKLPGPVEAALTGVEEKVTKLGFETKIRLISVAENNVKAEQKLQSAVGAFKQFNTTNMNGFQAGRVTNNDSGFLEEYQKRLFIKKGYILNIEELASIYHLPNISVETPSIVWAGAKKGEPPADLPVITDHDPEVAAFGITDFRGNQVKFGIKEDDRRRHMYLIGRTGVGKTSAMQNMVVEDMRTGKGVAVVDPHGDFIEHVLNFIPSERIDDVVLFDPSDTEHPLAFNLLENVNPELKNIVASGLIGIFKKLWADSWGPRLEHILRNTILALLEYPDSTMLGIMKMLVDENYRRKVVDQVTDPVIRDFWINEFERYDQKFRTEAVAPIQNKVGQFLSSSTIRNILGQPKSTINMEDIMNNKKILLINLSKGKIGEDNCALIGAMLITKIQITSMMRAKVHESERVDFYLYVDEFQNFATESFAVILSEARKYRLNIIMANQYIAQMDEAVQDAVFGNIGTMITFRVGAGDAPILAKEYIPVFEETDLINLDKYHIYVKMSIDGVTTIPFSAVTIPPFTDTTKNKETVFVRSREKYGRARKEVEDLIAERNISAVEELLKKQEKKGTGETPQEAEQKREAQAQVKAQPKPEEKPVGWQEITDINGDKFYVLYREEDKKNKPVDNINSPTRNPKNKVGQGSIGENQSGNNYPQKQVNENSQKKKNPGQKEADKKKSEDIQEQIKKMKDDNGHTILNEGETHEIERDNENRDS